jgi:hypothetical protein
MTDALRRSLMLIAILVAVLIAILFSIAPSDILGRRELTTAAARPPGNRPVLLLLTSLPLVFSEDFSLRESGSPALSVLETRYRVTPISVAAPAELSRGRVLMMAQPLAQPAEDLVALDRWVRRGGRVLLFADPLLEWPSKRPLGDPLRPPPMFLDTGLLGHWGLRLDAPEKGGEEIEKLGGLEILTVSPGQLSGTCQIASDQLVAHCAIGKGQVTVIGDADMLNVAQLGSGAARNLDAVLVELARLEQP